MAILNLRLFLLLPLVSTFVFPAVQYSTYRPVSNQYLMSLTPLSHEIFPSVTDLSLVLFRISFHFLFLFFLSITSNFYISFFRISQGLNAKTDTQSLPSPFPHELTGSVRLLRDLSQIRIHPAKVKFSNLL